MGDTERPELNLAQDRQYRASARCAACKEEIFVGPPLDGAEVSISRRLIEYALPPLQILHSHEKRCTNAKLEVQITELQAPSPLARRGRRHLRIVT